MFMCAQEFTADADDWLLMAGRLRGPRHVCMCVYIYIYIYMLFICLCVYLNIDSFNMLII